METIIPITAFITILLFLVKEVIESFRTSKKRAHTKKTVSLLLSYEIERNYWSVKSFFNLLNKLNEFDNLNEITLTIEKGIESNYSVKIEKSYDEWSGQAVPPFYNNRFNSLLVHIAELGEDKYKKIQDAYSALNELEDYRIQTLNLFSGNKWLTFPELTFDFLINLSKEYDDYYDKLNSAYICLTGKKLEKHRLD